MGLKEILETFRGAITEETIKGLERLTNSPLYKEFEQYQKTGVKGPMSTCGCTNCVNKIHKTVEEIDGLLNMMEIIGIMK